MSNCKAAKRGFIGQTIGWLISKWREWGQFFFVGDTMDECDEDVFANEVGSSGGRAGSPYIGVCEMFRPTGMLIPWHVE